MSILYYPLLIIWTIAFNKMTFSYQPPVKSQQFTIVEQGGILVAELGIRTSVGSVSKAGWVIKSRVWQWSDRICLKNEVALSTTETT